MPRLLLFLLLLPCFVHAQFYDRAWLVGFYGDIKLSYFTNTPDTSRFFNFVNNVYLTGDGCNVSDTLGNILFYSNGTKVGNPQKQLMENGNRMMDSIIDNNYPDGFSQPMANLILPKEGNQFYLFNLSVSDSLYSINHYQQTNRLYYAVIDMDSNGGLGKVINKRNTIWDGRLLDNTRLTACRHANGRDWWLISHVFLTDEYVIYLVTPDSIYPPLIQHIGPAHVSGYVGQSVFSSDGSLFASALFNGPVTILKFDRCSGQFSFRDTIVLHNDTIYQHGQVQVICDSLSEGGCSFSPNGKFLYISTLCYLMQYDMQADTISKSGVMVARVDTAEYPAPKFFSSFLMPNGEIVMCSWEYTPTNFHLIKLPDLKAPNCDFRYYGLATNAISASRLPNMVSYRMGALLGSSCDTLHTGISELETGKNGLKIYPNPANDYISISLLQYHKNSKLSIYDALSKEVYHNENTYLDDNIDVRKFSSGIYLIKISSTDGNLMERFVKE